MATALRSISDEQITVIFQGYVHGEYLGSGREDGLDFLYNVATTRQALPNATIILSTWSNLPWLEAFDTLEKLGLKAGRDQLILTDDPGGLPNIKFGYTAPNNVNRQIASTRAGLAATDTAYALKLRTDSYLTSNALLEAYQGIQACVIAPHVEYDPIAVASYFTIDPAVHERMAFHVSDWVQFGRSERLRAYWDAVPMSYEDATYFEVPRDKSLNPITHLGAKSPPEYVDDTFRTRLAVEQHIVTQFAKQFGYHVPSRFNELSPKIEQDYQDFLARHMMVLSLEQLGVRFPKYNWVTDSAFMAMNCLSHEDWYQIFYDHWQFERPDLQKLAIAKERRKQKRVAAEQALQQRKVQPVFVSHYPSG